MASMKTDASSKLLIENTRIFERFKIVGLTAIDSNVVDDAFESFVFNAGTFLHSRQVSIHSMSFCQISLRQVVICPKKAFRAQM